MFRWKSDHGQSIVEFALVLPMLLVVCIGLAELGRITWAWNVAQQAAAEGARHAIVIGNGAWKDTVESAARKMMFAKDGTGPGMFQKVSITSSVDNSTTPATIVVDVAIPVRPLMDFWTRSGGPAYTIHGRSRMDVQPSFKEEAPAP